MYTILFVSPIFFIKSTIAKTDLLYMLSVIITYS